MSSSPTPVGPYRPIVRAGDLLACSGQLGLTGGKLAEGIVEQVRHAVANLAQLLATEGASLSDVVKTTVFLVDMVDFPLMNEAYVEAFGDCRPARSAVAVRALPLGAVVEVEAWAYKPAT